MSNLDLFQFRQIAQLQFKNRFRLYITELEALD